MHHSNPPRHQASITARAARRLRVQLAREAAIRRHHGIEPVTVPHHLYGTVNSLPRWVWDLAAECPQSLLDAQEVAG